jgi:hypothetical protein
MRDKGLFTRLIRLPAVLGVSLWWLAATPAMYGQSPDPPAETAFLSRLPVLSDFDGDNKLDRAELSSHGRHKQINLTFGGSLWKSLSFDSGVYERGSLIWGDVDRDGDADLIWISQQPRKLILWIGDGHGNFTIAPDGPARPHWLQELSREPSKPGVSGNADDDDLDAVVPSSIHASLQEGYVPQVISCRGQPHFTPPFIFQFSVLSGIRKRGPPSLLF